MATPARRAGPAPKRASSRRISRAALGGAALLLALVATLAGAMPVVMGAAYLFFSVVAYAMYWTDKAAAQAGRRRTPENTLHFVALVGGWPGALMAQQRFRHKTAKQSFQAVFWLTVLGNLAGAGWLIASGSAESAWRALGI